MFNNILVTGCGGDIGLGIGRILKMSGVADRVIGCDIHSDHPASTIFDSTDLIVKALDKNYFNLLQKLVDKYSIDLIIPTSEAELNQFYNKQIFDQFIGIPVIITNPKSLEIGLDKLLTAEFLKTNGFPYPWTRLIKDGRPINVPCIIKSRFGSGSKGVQKINEDLVDVFSVSRLEDIWQEYLPPDDEEYTCGLYRTLDGDIRTISIKRKLQGGSTYSGVVVSNEKIDLLLHNLAIALDLRGSINVQLRLTERGPIIFEINPRFSSTIVFRHLMGFQDLIWSVNEKANLKPTEYIPPSPNTKFYRMAKELILD